MKILVRNGLSLHLMQNDDVVQINSENVTIGNPVHTTIWDCNSENTILRENVTPPEDWVNGKYLFDGSNWSVNSSYSEPEAELIEE